MHLVYSLEEPPHSFNKSLFLAGPTPRSSEVASWRPQALEILGKLNYDGVVFIPENRNNDFNKYDEGLYPPWEHRAMDMSDLIIFWVPRDLTLMSDGKAKMPALTTNVEYGLSAHLGKSLFGPPKGQKNNYLKFVAEKAEYNIPQFDTLEEMLARAVEILGDGAERTGGEREIPLFLWKHKAFQNWYQAQLSASNWLDGAKVEWLSRVRNKPEAIFAFAIRPNIFVSCEDRNKVNDPVIFRLDISSVVLYKKRLTLLDSEVVIVREFRSASSTADGFIWELPGGSSPFITDPLEVAVEEVVEEVGLPIVPERLFHVGSRQMAGTLSEHKSHTYSVELTDEELAWCKTQKGIPHGADFPDNPTGERAYMEVLTLREIKERDLVDWANFGMIYRVLGS